LECLISYVWQGFGWAGFEALPNMLLISSVHTRLTWIISRRGPNVKHGPATWLSVETSTSNTDIYWWDTRGGLNILPFCLASCILFISRTEYWLHGNKPQEAPYFKKLKNHYFWTRIL
jgi:hypothetical protein